MVASLRQNTIFLAKLYFHEHGFRSGGMFLLLVKLPFLDIFGGKLPISMLRIGEIQIFVALVASLHMFVSTHSQ